MMELLTKSVSQKGIEDEKKIVGFANSIDDCIKNLDIEMDQVLERHERDFLAAYRKHMIAVQRELQDLKAKGTETELQFRQNQRVMQLQKMIHRYREDCTNIMKYCTLQQKAIDSKQDEEGKLKYDSYFLDEQLMECKVENYKLKVKLADKMNECK